MDTQAQVDAGRYSWGGGLNLGNHIEMSRYVTATDSVIGI